MIIHVNEFKEKSSVNLKKLAKILTKMSVIYPNAEVCWDVEDKCLNVYVKNKDGEWTYRTQILWE